MSPLWRDEVAIYLAPRKLALARRLKGLKPRIGASTEIVVPDGGADPAATLQRLADVLREPAWQQAAARVVVSDAWVRFGIVPAVPARLDADAREAHARCVLADTYGEMLREWRIALEEAPPGRAAVVCAMPGALRAQIETALAPASLQLRSIQPQLAVAFNAWRGRLPADDAWFVKLEEGWLSAVHLAHGGWDRVHTARLSRDAGLDLERMQAFGRLGADGRMFIEAPAWMRERYGRMNTNLEWLEADGGDPGPTHEISLLLRAQG
ncbi:MAG TPA: hypothetical protein VHY75_09675 [Steroidobacteraceae bacterium]|nr:hypothetical protein [Steroidobacteraceae bacterium]